MEDIKDKKEEVVIPDECGDTLWDAVLQQGNEENSNAALLKKINEVKKRPEVVETPGTTA